MMRFSQVRARYRTAPFDRGVLWGIGLCVVLVLGGVLGSGRGLNFIDIPSFLLVLGGTLGAGLVHFSGPDLRAAGNALRDILIAKSFSPLERIRFFVALSGSVRRDGFLTLEREARRSADPFLRKALEISVDGPGGEEVRRTLEIESRCAADRSLRSIQVFETLGSYAPAMGLIGTIIGLIQMLGDLTDPSKVGPAMALALLTTFYGALLANLLFLPVAGRLRNRAEEATVLRAVTIEGIVGIANRENTIVVEQRLQSFLPREGGASA
jgi:chemotaxis protein MotA